MKKLFCSYEVCLILQSLGFNEKCLGYYKHRTKKLNIQKQGISFPIDYKYAVVAPTHSQVQEWIVKNYNLELNVYRQLESPSYACWCTWANLEDEESFFKKSFEKEDYSETLNIGILEVLQLIIKYQIKPN